MTHELMDDDKQLISKAQKGDLEAFEKLIVKYQRKIYRIACYMMLNRDEADDVTQAVFITLWESIGKIKSIEKFNTWLYRITVNRAIDAIRKRKREATVDIEIIKKGTDQEKRLILQYDIEKIFQDVAKKLPEQQRAVFLLRDIQGLEMAEIAQILNISESTVRSHLSLARQNFQQQVRDRYPEYSGKKPGANKDKRNDDEM